MNFSTHQAPDRVSPLNASAACAVVVAFFPDREFDDRLCTLLPQVGMLVIVDNTPEKERTHWLKEFYGHDARISVIENQTNVGVAAALNQGLAVALEHGYKWILTLDQDTKCYPDMVQTLIRVYESCGAKPAVIGGNYFDLHKRRLRVSAGTAGEFLEQKAVITAGSLIDTSLACAIGGFREDYFIDQVDHEFCLRARAHGYQVFISRMPVMEHGIGGETPIRVPLLGIALPNHSPLRKYYIARNTLVSVMDYWRGEPLWCLHRLARLLFELGSIAILQKNRFAKLRAFAAGLMDGMYRHMGSCRRAWLYRND